MNHLISPEYQEAMETMHETRRNFGIGTANQVKAADLLRVSLAMGTQDILDYGCGKGYLSLNLPFKIHNYDPGIPKWSASPDPHDIVICADVMEHVEPECTEAVLADIARVTKKVAYFAICLCEANKHLPDGRNAHINLRSPDEWVELIEKEFDLVEPPTFVGKLKVEGEVEPKDIWLRVMAKPKHG